MIHNSYTKGGRREAQSGVTGCWGRGAERKKQERGGGGGGGLKSNKHGANQALHCAAFFSSSFAYCWVDPPPSSPGTRSNLRMSRASMRNVEARRMREDALKLQVLTVAYFCQRS
jgi:hypothetical protein